MPATNDLIIPEAQFRRIRETHAAGIERIVACGVQQQLESVAIAETVESHRWAWKPERVRLLLVAESHVFTTLSEIAVTYRNPPGAEQAPSNYVRLVYCLGYGESLLCHGLRGGTPQYWNIFGKLVGTTPKHIKGRDRLGEKVRTLLLLRQAGVWLLDASLHGIYMPKGSRIDTARGQLTADLQRLWWNGYGRAVVEDEKPERILAVGKGLYSNMRDVIPFSDWMYQPQGARNNSQIRHNSEVLERLSMWLSDEFA